MTVSTSIQDRLAKQITPTSWTQLEPHLRRAALFVVDPAVPLLDVAVAVAEDRKTAIEDWLEASRLARPTTEQIEAWGEEKGTRFTFVIVQPFVLAQRIDLDVGR